MSTLTINQGVAAAMAEEMQRDGTVIYFGEGVATKNPELVEQFGKSRVRNTPLAEAIIAGTAVGAAASGLRPVIDLLFTPFLTYAMDAIVNSAGKLRYMSGGQFSFPLVVLARSGAGWTLGAQHNHNLEAWFLHSPGLKVVMPSNPADTKGLLKSAIRDNNPVLFFTDITVSDMPAEIDGEIGAIPLGQAHVARAGSDVTLISYSKAVATCLDAATQLAAQGVSAEVLDLRTIKPLDEAAILASARKTGRVIVVHEAGRLGGVGAEVAALIHEQAFGALKAPVQRIGAPDVPPPSSYMLEQAYMPQASTIIDSALRLLGR
ncbi:alpha-ketoacid dehydrogenase subunit beta [Massilia sp. TS11]|uniref:alpha-ketoacid dehydrogenase subunit beta n=1 Tax=Massilia sp. TS11 TaxID=2908003 RepID=UPI001EDAF499|nr:pyruvate dehydrogenase complex E1 component subunit beta [Massilia sp. TS11]MCG2583780.1 pyruvate dehydrogenase complex E1 component subunit beta [Massilia sp. TS11]